MASQPKTVREELTSLTAQFKKKPLTWTEKREAANKHLQTLADDPDNFLEMVREKVRANLNRSAEEVRFSPDLDPNKVGFFDQALRGFGPEDVGRMSGYERLNEICARKDVDMRLSLSWAIDNNTDETLTMISINTNKPYSRAVADASINRSPSRGPRPSVNNRFSN